MYKKLKYVVLTGLHRGFWLPAIAFGSHDIGKNMCNSVCLCVFQMWMSVKILCSVLVKSVSTVRARIAVCPVSLDMDCSTGSVQVTHTCWSEVTHSKAWQ